jgi:hypothetical protein
MAIHYFLDVFAVITIAVLLIRFAMGPEERPKT